MKTCFFTIGCSIDMAFRWYQNDLRRHWEARNEKELQGIYREVLHDGYPFGREDVRLIGVYENGCDDEDTGREDTLYLDRKIEGEFRAVEQQIIDVLKGKRVIAQTAKYAKQFETLLDNYFDTDEIQLIFLTSSYGSFYACEAPEIINFIITKLSCMYPQCKIHARTIAYSTEFADGSVWNPKDVLHSRTRWFLDRYLTEKSMLEHFCEEYEVYVIDKSSCGFDDLFLTIGFEPELLRKMDKKQACLDGPAIRTMKVDKLEEDDGSKAGRKSRNEFGWKA